MTSLMLSALAAASLGQTQTAEMRLMRFPTIHGDTVVFTYAGDLWSASTKGGLARRLTTHPGLEQRSRISPDGKWVAFTGEYDGNPDVYVVSIDGGEPTRLTFEPGNDLMIDWTPDGKVAYKSQYGSPFVARLWMIDPKGGLPQRTAVEEIADGTFSPDGSVLAYNRSNAHQFNWRRYRGGTQGKISFFNLKDGSYSEIASQRENSWFPMFVGEDVFYVSDKNQGTVNLYKYNVKSKALKQVTNFGDADIKWPETDGKTIVYERDGYLYTFDIATSKIERLSPRVLSDNVNARPQYRNVGGQISGLALSPSAVRVAVEARGDIFSVPAKNGETRNLTNSTGSRERFPAWSPDGKSIAYVSDATGDQQVYVQPQMGGDAVQLTTEAGLAPTSLEYSPDGKYLSFTTRGYKLYILEVETKKLTLIRAPKYSGNTAHDWSPDSKWIAYMDGTPNFQDCVWLYEVATGKKTQVTDGFYSDGSVAFDMNGKYLYFSSNRTFNPGFGIFEMSLKIEDATRLYAIPLTKDLDNPLLLPPDEEGATPAKPADASKDVKIDLDGMAQRAVVLPMPTGTYQIVAGMNGGFWYADQSGVYSFTMGQPAPTQIYQGFPSGAFAFNPNRTKLAYFMQGTLGIANAAPGFQVGAGRVGTTGVAMSWTPRDEWKQIFWEGWRFQRDNFYDKDMLGLDWKAIGDRYAKYLPYVSHRTDLNYVMGMLIGELGTGHSYVNGGEMSTTPMPGVPTGQLGVDFVADGQFVKMARILRGRNYEEQSRGPLAEPGLNVNDGDYLLAIDGAPVRSNMNPNSLLIGKVGRTVVLTINTKPSNDGARTIRVRPISTEANLRYVEWVETNRKIVDKLSGGKLGYIHVPNTAFEGSVEIVRGFYSQVDKEAVLVDERFNGGGYIQPWFVDTLARRTKAWIQQRHFEDAPEAVAMEGPMCLLINGYAGSGGDFFPWMFKQAGRGPLIGKRTWGGLVGISAAAPFVDGGSMNSPEFGIYDHKAGKWIAENTGVDPDIDVDARPDLLAKGQDPQLEAGVKYLLDELKKNPRKGLNRPKFIPATIPPK